MNVELMEKHFSYSNGNLFWKVPSTRSVKVGQKAGSLDSHGYLRVVLFGKRMFVHRIIWVLKTGKQLSSNIEIDHINNNPLDNRFENLRLATRSENQQNKLISKNNSSGVKGVSWDKLRKKWQAHSNLNGRKIGLGRFSNIADAEKAVMNFRTKNHGEFCNHG